ncbi:MAG: glycosyltransferase family 2 protein [Gammaproteobacteria bacterium]|nr:glycosyltransferase family 2 protein [Gammaproteobacteria bacterium]
MKIIIIIPVFNRRVTTLNCLRQLQVVEHAGIDLTTVVVDDASTDGTKEAISSEYPDVVIIDGGGDLWWTGGINAGVNYALGHDFDYTLFLNDDLELDMNFLMEIVSVARIFPDALVSGVKLLKQNSDKEKIVASVFRRVGWLKEIVDPYSGMLYDVLSNDNYLSADILTGAALLTPVKVYRKIGKLDEKRFPHNWGDLEFTLRASQAGFQCLVATKAKIYVDGDNPNYHNRYLVESSRIQYLKNIFDNHKYTYGFGRIWNWAFMHRPFYVAWVLFIKKSVVLCGLVFFKTILPHDFFAKKFNRDSV